MRCFHCKKSVNKEDNYFLFIEYKGKRKIRVDYCHKVCWDFIKEYIVLNAQATGILRGVKKSLMKLGLFKQGGGT
jgi:hypothetical protein